MRRKRMARGKSRSREDKLETKGRDRRKRTRNKKRTRKIEEGVAWKINKKSKAKTEKKRVNV